MTYSDYAREFIRADEKRKAEEALETKLLEGVNSPESELTATDWRIIRKDVLAKLEAKRVLGNEEHGHHLEASAWRE